MAPPYARHGDRFDRMPEIDPTFTALPYRELGAAALARAQELGATHADFRFERVRHQHVGVRDGALQGASDTEDLGFAVRVIHRGSWGFASGVILTTDEAVRVAETADRGRRGRRRDDHRSPSRSPPSRSTTTSPGSRRTT